MRILRILVGFIDIPAIERGLWHLFSDYILFLDSKLFALLRGITINLMNNRLSIAYVYKNCSFYSFRNIHLGKNVIIKKGCRITGPLIIGDATTIDQGVVLAGPITMGMGCHVNYHAWIDRYVTLGDRVGIGHRSFLLTFIHEHSDPAWRWGKEMLYKPITVGDGNWVGASVVILPGVEIGFGSIIGAGSVVTKNIPECTLAAGNPAKVVRQLNAGETNPSSQVDCD